MKTIFDESYNTLIECLKDERKKKNLTQLELARLINRDQSYVSRYERFERRLDVIEVRTLCISIGLNFPEFISRFEKILMEKGI